MTGDVSDIIGHTVLSDDDVSDIIGHTVLCDVSGHW
jgi:hypothetical protein